MQTICEIAGIDGDVWSLEQEDDRQFLFHTPDADSVGPLNRIPVDEHVLCAMWRASRGAAVVVGRIPGRVWA
jgi:hypothetical protein